MNEAVNIGQTVNAALSRIKQATDVQNAYNYWMALCRSIYKEKHGWPSTLAVRQFDSSFILLDIQGVVRRGPIKAPVVPVKLNNSNPTREGTGSLSSSSIHSLSDKANKIESWKRVISIEALDNHARLVGKKAALHYLMRCLANDDLTLQDIGIAALACWAAPQ